MERRGHQMSLQTKDASLHNVQGVECRGRETSLQTEDASWCYFQGGVECRGREMSHQIGTAVGVWNVAALGGPPLWPT